MRTMQEFLDRADQYIKLETAEGNLGKSSPDSKKNDSKKEKESSKNGAGNNKENKNDKRPQEYTSNDSKRPNASGLLDLLSEKWYFSISFYLVFASEIGLNASGPALLGLCVGLR